MRVRNIGIAFKFLFAVAAVFLFVQGAVVTLSMLAAQDIAHALAASALEDGGVKPGEAERATRALLVRMGAVSLLGVVALCLLTYSVLRRIIVKPFYRLGIQLGKHGGRLSTTWDGPCCW